MFDQDRIEFLKVADIGENKVLMVSLWDIEADMEDNWRERRVFIQPDMFTFRSCQIFIEDTETKKSTVLVDANAGDRPKGYNFFRASDFFLSDEQGSLVWDTIEDYVNEVGNEEASYRNWDAEMAEIEADHRYHAMREDGEI